MQNPKVEAKDRKETFKTQQDLAFEQMLVTYETNQGWSPVELIGEGYSSRIYKIMREYERKGKQIKEVRALKIINAKNNKKDAENRIALSFDLETMLLSDLSSVKGINKVLQCCRGEEMMCFAMPFHQNGNLAEFLPIYNENFKVKNERNCEKYKEQNNQRQKSKECEKGPVQVSVQDYRRIIKHILSQIVMILSQVHEKGIIHRDIKLSNFMLDENYDVVLIDFGMAMIHEEEMLEEEKFPFSGSLRDISHKLNSRMDFLVGTREYLPPELIGGRSSRFISDRIDIWAFGVLAFQLFSMGLKIPFSGKTISSLNHCIREDNPSLDNFPFPLSENQKELLTKSLMKNPKERISAKQLMQLPYFEGILFETVFQVFNPILKVFYPERFIEKSLYQFSKASIVSEKKEIKTEPAVSDLLNRDQKAEEQVMIKIKQDREGFRQLIISRSQDSSTLASFRMGRICCEVLDLQKPQIRIQDLSNDSEIHLIKFKSVKERTQFYESIQNFNKRK